ncbi:MAG: hypothetical protein IKO01_05980 [Kiritimatiellae bacterium]|nr:hypothetical protein [Kiritimatiellia bacterium]
MTDDKKPTMAERATWPLGGLVLKDFTIRDPSEDDEETFTLEKKLADGSEIEWRIALPLKAILRLCQAEGLELGDEWEHAFKKAPIRVVAWSGSFDGSSCYAYCDFPGMDAKETDLDTLTPPEEQETEADEDISEDDWQ